MSNRGRQNVASYLVLDLGIDWRKGADWFESVLTDYDVASNWGNWVSAAGLTGGRVNHFNTVKQSKASLPPGILMHSKPWDLSISVITNLNQICHAGKLENRSHKYYNSLLHQSCTCAPRSPLSKVCRKLLNLRQPFKYANRPSGLPDSQILLITTFQPATLSFLLLWYA